MIERTELVQRIIRPPLGRCLIVAGAGFGKTVLLEQVRNALGGSTIIVRRPIAAADLSSFVVELSAATRRSGHVDMAAAILGTGGDISSIAHAVASKAVAIAVDDINQWDDEVGAFLIDLVSSSPSTPFIIAGRHMPPLLADLHHDPRWQLLGSDDLSFSKGESMQELVSQGLVDEDLTLALHQMTNGWPLALQTVANRIAGSQDPAHTARELARNNLVVDQLLQSYLTQLSPQDLEAAGALALLPFFDSHLADTLGSPGVLDRLGNAGVPITYRSDGWAEISERFRAALSRSEMPKIPASAIAYFVDRHEVHAAINTCLNIGDREAAASVLAGLDLNQQTQLEPASLNATMTIIGSAAATAPRSLLVQAQVNATFGRASEGLAYLERAVAMSGGTDCEPRDESHLEVLLELATWRTLFGDDVSSKILLDHCRPHVRDSQPALLARIFDLEALHSYAENTPTSVEVAIDKFTEAIAIWREIGEPRPTAISVFRLADALGELGRSAEALDVLDALPSAGPMTAINRARLGIERGALLPSLGRASEVREALAEARQIASALGHPWLLGAAAGTEIVAASILGDNETTEQLYSLLDDDRFAAVNELMQAQIWCTAVEALARMAMFDQANHLLERVRDIPSFPGWLYDYHAASVAARTGDTKQALATLRPLLSQPDVEQNLFWRIELLTSLCYWHEGDDDAKNQHFALAISEAAAFDRSSLPSIIEPRLVEQLRSPAAKQGISNRPIGEIELFDRFSISINGEPLAIPAGNPSHLLKLVVLNGGQLVVDQAIDPLWPDASIATGRRRLRNVLYRLRAAAGDVVERSVDMLRVAPAVDSDYARAIAATNYALDPSSGLADVALAIDALDRPLLPEDRYEEWAEAARSNANDLLLRLYDRQAVLAEEAGDIDLAAQALASAHSRDPFRSDRLTRAKRLLQSSGREAAAAALGRNEPEST